MIALRRRIEKVRDQADVIAARQFVRRIEALTADRYCAFVLLMVNAASYGALRARRPYWSGMTDEEIRQSFVRSRPAVLGFVRRHALAVQRRNLPLTDYRP